MPMPRDCSPRSPRALGVGAEHVFSAYEDVFYYAWRERKLAANVDAINSKVADPRRA